MTCPKCGASNPGLATRCTQCDSQLPESHSDSTWGGERDSSPSPAPVSDRADAATRASFAGGSGNFPTAVGVSRARSQSGSEVDFGPRYRVEKLLGQGGMGAVYKAYDLDLNRTVALKLVRPELMVHPEAMQRFKQELLLASKISHKNILRIHDLGDAAGTKFISMAFVDGSDLYHVLQSQGKLSIERTLHIAKQLCAALEAAHGEDVVHRDMKPQNIMLDKDDHVYVSDFGLAKSIESEGGMTMTGELLGTPRYMAPEQIECKPVDGRTDLYALGLIIYEMLTGDVPFQAESTFQLMYKRANEAPPEPKAVNPEIPDWLNQVVMKCLERDPERRYKSARAILNDLELQQSPSGFSPSMSIRLPQMAVNVPMSKRVFAGIVAGALIVSSGIAVIGYRYLHKSSAEQVAVVPQHRVAVLPLEILGDQSALGYIGSGVTEALSAKLFQIKDLRVASASAVQKISSTDSLPDIAKSLGVNYIVTGTLQGSADKIRVVMNLVDENGKQIWTQEFAGLPSDLLSIEDDIGSKLMSALEVKASNEEIARVSSHPTENANAYGLYLKGRSLLSGNLDSANVTKAINFFNQAAAMDHEFALAYTGLADANLRMYLISKDQTWADKARGAAEQSKQLGPNLPETHFALGTVYSATGKTNEAVAELQQALELNPNSDDGYRRLGDIYRKSGRKDEALSAFEKAISINPYYWYNSLALGNAYLSFGDNDKAKSAYTRVTELAPKNPIGYSNIGAVYLREGKWNDCIPYFQKALEYDPNYLLALGNIGTAYFYLGRYDDAVKMFERAVAVNPNQEMMVGNLADAYRWSGQQSKANAMYDKAIALAQKELQVNPRNASTMGSLALYYAKKGDQNLARQFIRQARSVNQDDNELMYIQGVVAALGNRDDEAISALSQAFQKGYAASEAQNDPELKRLTSQPEFQKLISQYSAKTK